MDWIAEGWTLFRMRPGAWIALGAIDLLVTVVLASLPVVNGLAPVFAVLWAGGMTAAAETCRIRGTVSISDAFTGMREHLQPLCMLCLVSLAAVIVCDFAGDRVASAFQALVSGNTDESAGTAWLAALLYMAVALGAAMALWLAPALVVLHRAAPIEALKGSIAALRRNPWATLVYGAVIAGLAGAALLTLGIGLIVVAPLAYLSTYAACRDLFVFTEDD